MFGGEGGGYYRRLWAPRVPTPAGLTLSLSSPFGARPPVANRAHQMGVPSWGQADTPRATCTELSNHRALLGRSGRSASCVSRDQDRVPKSSFSDLWGGSFALNQSRWPRRGPARPSRWPLIVAHPRFLAARRVLLEEFGDFGA